ncbi:MAG: TolC family protein, partial [Rhodomicrobium sp.]
MGVRGIGAYIWTVASLALAAAGIGLACSEAAADTLEWALVQAYQNNQSLNAQRAALRATDENVPQALSGYRPKLSVTAQGGYNYTNATQELPIGGVVSQ